MEAREGNSAVRSGENGANFIENNRPRIRCPYCPSSLKDPTTLSLHFRKKHPTKSAEAINDSLAIGTLKRYINCAKCGLLLFGKKGLNMHRSAKKNNCHITAQEADNMLRNQLGVQDQDPDSSNNSVVSSLQSDDDGADTANQHQCTEQELLEARTAYSKLLEAYIGRLDCYHYTWRDPLANVLTKLFREQQSRNYMSALKACVAFLVLTGLIVYLRRALKGQRGETVVSVLRAFADSPTPAIHILERAESAQDTARSAYLTRQANRTPPTIAQLKRLAENRADRGRLSLAMKAVDQLHCLQTGRSPAERLSYNDARSIIQDLHPAPNAGATPLSMELMEDLPEGVELSPEDIAAAFKRIDVSSAAGSFTGWTNGVIISLVLSSHDSLREGLIAAFTGLTNCFCAGKASQHVAYMWAISRAVLLEKLPIGYRPLGIGEDWYRVMARAMAKYTAPDAGNYLLPLQLGTGVKGGVEIAARMARLALRSGNERTPMALICIDQSNAFNTCRRDHILEGLKEGLPGLCRFFTLFHSFSSELRSGTGELLGYSQTGVHQGDPLGGTYHNMGFQPTLVELDERIRTLVKHASPTDREPPCAVFAIHDDSYVALPPRLANEGVRIINALFEERGIQLNVSKCKIISDQDIPNAAYTLVRDGQVVLGTPIGFGEYEKDTTIASLNKKLEPLPALLTINPHVATRLMERCVNQRVQYMSRTAEFEGSRIIFRDHFDVHIDRFLAAILGENPPPDPPPPEPNVTVPPLPMAAPGNISVHRSLPRSLGGMGMIAYGGPIGEAGVCASRELTLKFLECHYPFLCESTARWNPLTLIDTAERFCRKEMEEQREENSTGVAEAKIASKALLRKWATDLHNRLMEDDSPEYQSRAAWLRSAQFKGAARWLTWHGGVHGTFRLTSLEFRDSLRLLFLLPPVAPTHGPHRYCDCGADIDEEPLHVLDCVKSLHVYNRRRHDAIVRALVQYIKQCLGTDQLSVEVESFLDTGDATAARVKADIVVYKGHEKYVLDVTICEPGAPSYRAQNSMTVECAAANFREEAKRRQYSRVPGLILDHPTDTRVTPATSPPQPFIPFAIEATGRMGRAASHFIDWLCKDKHYSARSHFLDRTGSVLAKYNAAMLHRSRGSIVYQQG